MPEDVIQQVHCIAESQNMPQGLIFHNRHGCITQLDAELDDNSANTGSTSDISSVDMTQHVSSDDGDALDLDGDDGGYNNIHIAQDAHHEQIALPP